MALCSQRNLGRRADRWPEVELPTRPRDTHLGSNPEIGSSRCPIEQCLSDGILQRFPGDVVIVGIGDPNVYEPASFQTGIANVNNAVYIRRLCI